MNLINIILWTTSITLAVAGIAFGISASINATRANKQIKELVSDQILSEEANKSFFTKLSIINNKNRSIIKFLNLEKDVFYMDYSLKASETRMIPIPKRIEKYLMDSEYKDLTIKYIEIKYSIDENFKKIIGNYEILSSKKNISKSRRVSLIKYHELMIFELKKIMKEYHSIYNK